MVPFEKPNIPSFHHSRFPKKLRFTNPLGMITHGHLKNRFWTKVIGDIEAEGYHRILQEGLEGGSQVSKL